MGVRNKTSRRLILEVLFEHGPMNKTEIFEHIKNNHRVLRENTEHSMLSIMQKSSQAIVIETELNRTQTGNKTTIDVFDINRDKIRTYDDLVKSMPIGLLNKKEIQPMIRCNECLRNRLPHDIENQLCVECRID